MKSMTEFSILSENFARAAAAGRPARLDAISRGWPDHLAGSIHTQLGF